jgi:hypothetical protein
MANRRWVRPDTLAMVIGLFGAWTIFKGVGQWDILRIVTGASAVVAFAGICAGINVLAAGSLVLFFALGAGGDAYWLLHGRFDWFSLAVVVAQVAALVFAVGWLHAIWRRWRGLPWRNWLFRR